MKVGSGLGLAVAWVGTATAAVPAAEQPVALDRVADQAKAASARRNLFGFDLSHCPLPDGLIGRNGVTGGALARVDSIVSVASRAHTGRWLLILANDARWEEADSLHASGAIEPGMPIAIRKAGFGSYFATVGKDIHLRVRRVG